MALRKKPRKSRGRGLRTTTGCLTCRKRHKKCDERVPVCGSCQLASRACVYSTTCRDVVGAPSTGISSNVGKTAETDSPGQSKTTETATVTEPTIDPQLYTEDIGTRSINDVGCVAHSLESLESLDNNLDSTLDSSLVGSLSTNIESVPSLNDLDSYSQCAATVAAQTVAPNAANASPDASITSEMLVAGGASVVWLDLLASDAAQADASFSLMPSPVECGHRLSFYFDASTHETTADPLTEEGRMAQRLYLQQQYQLYLEQQYQEQQRWEEQRQKERRELEEEQLKKEKEIRRIVQLPPDGDKSPWQELQDIVLQDDEKVLLRHFTEHAALWLDMLDLERHFGTYATRLALRNLGLMKAILALAARHRIMAQDTHPTSKTTSKTDSSPSTASSHTNTSEPTPSAPVDRNSAQAIQYYYETLHYLQHALQFPSYTMSEEILATAIVVSTYEMLDQSAPSNWQRHLKGVFWIQRSQHVHGASGGLRQAVWWAWLRQDVWAAFKERRGCFTFWRPIRGADDPADLRGDSQALADHAVYLLSQAVNYAAVAADQRRDEEHKQTGERLLDALGRWKSALGSQFDPLPCPSLTQDSDIHIPWEPIWIHPPRSAIAVMVYHFARILVTLHCPPDVGLYARRGYLSIQRQLSAAVAAIAGIAQMLTDEGCQLTAAQCLYGAGMCVQQPTERRAILKLISDCERRTGWPMTRMRRDLEEEWRGDDT